MRHVNFSGGAYECTNRCYNACDLESYGRNIINQTIIEMRHVNFSGGAYECTNRCYKSCCKEADGKCDY